MADDEKKLLLARACAEKMYAADLASRELGIDVSIPATGNAEAAMTITPEMINGHDVCHGGYVFTLADTAFAFACNAYDQVTVAAGATVEFLAPVRVGDRLLARAQERYRGRRSGAYDVEITNQDDLLVALFRGRSIALDRRMLDDES
ncbi:MAG: hydroxyphenylacetyl-CoA thioesterase PaaI [Gammaproteobacteria bacterium]|nr:hydroxyphenylacetyl-CoA thioesterase PaaI [Gammaproteobacteria bacterium]